MAEQCLGIIWRALFIFSWKQLVSAWFVHMIVCQDTCEKYDVLLDAMSKNKSVSKIATILKFRPWCFVSEDCDEINEWTRAQRVWVHALTKGKHETRHSTHFPLRNPINFATLRCLRSWVRAPNLAHPSIRPSEVITISSNNGLKAFPNIFEGQINGS